MGSQATLADVSPTFQGLSRHDENLIWEWNNAVPSSVNKLVPDLIHDNVRASPDSPAVCSWDGNLTYGELDELSSCLASQLRIKGVRRDVIVPLCFEKSAWTVVAMLATIKAGGAFVLLDAAQPQARLRDIVSLTQAKFIITSPKQQELASKIGPEALVVSHDILKAMPAATNPTPGADPEDTLFVVFTSGSTGLPKGVMSSHRSFASGVQHRRSILEVPSPRVFDFASYSFDVSTDIILSTLIIGGCICVPSDWERQNDIPGAINRLAVNSADLTPSVARLIKPDSVPGLQVLKVGGELSSVADVALWASKTKLVNVYGPSECLLVTINVIPPNGDPRTIGRGHGAVTWVVDPDDHNKLVPVGTVGELVVEGPIVTKGYLHDPERTATVFVESPDWLPARLGIVSKRLYKTGDLVHYNPDGTLNFVGRKDTQVKVRGQRVELSEVEHHIQQQIFSRTGLRINPIVELITPGANQGKGQPTLVGFLAMSQVEPTEPSDAQELRESMWNLTKELNKALLRTLPKYMVPSVYIPLWKFPLNPSGKTDRRQLQSKGSALSRQELTSFRPPLTTTASSSTTPPIRSRPETSMEQKLQSLWAHVLGLPVTDIAREDHFLRLGGDSLTAIQLAAAATRDHLSLTVENIFGNPVLSRMAVVARPLENVKLETLMAQTNISVQQVEAIV